ncbi:alpha/beta fold hydrolase [Pseudoprimorskyibacter insulae]|uniref:Tropinesterase n=1 Tax=Pseudoprimorskyibacter insulae TaxID=1695997 RepID=A0A2R8AQN9_9RHOB|nr:alpha/beta hydrolase [Pseudoprimorskyibacter insulae]SPF78159.1 Tropinesterase [Pseudoprimorskyibacter insulae]
MSFAQINGVSLRYDWRPGAGVPLVLLHEMGGTLDSWDLVLPLLGDRAVLRMDLRGFGLSEKPTGAISLADHVGDIVGLIDHLGLGAVHLAGCAVGGGIAIAVAAELQDRAEALTVFAPATGVPRERRAGLLGLADMLERDGLRGFLEGDTIPKAWPQPRFARDAGFDLFLATQLSAAPSMLAATYRMLADVDLAPALANLRCRATFVAGSHDIARTPALVAQVAAKVPGARFMEIDSSHFMALQDPDKVAAILLDAA